jgi:endonuclease/exonuclease/phosphatase (EEP) superfamily protein YafD
VPVAVLGRSRVLGIALLAVMTLAVSRLGDEWSSPPAPTATGHVLTMASWNLELESRPAQESADWLADHPADVVALQELTPDVADAIDADGRLRQAYPYRALERRDFGQGLGLLSRYPISGVTHLDQPFRQEAVVTVAGTGITLVNAHTKASRIYRIGSVPVGLDPTIRNEQLDAVRQRVGQLLAAGLRVVVFGDFNTAPTEPAYRRLVDGLVDVHRAVGQGPGWTWRPKRFEFIGIGLLRIDLVLVGPGIAPLSESSSCPPAGDHCWVQTTLSLEAP